MRHFWGCVHSILFLKVWICALMEILIFFSSMNELLQFNATVLIKIPAGAHETIFESLWSRAATGTQTLILKNLLHSAKHEETACPNSTGHWVQMKTVEILQYSTNTSCSEGGPSVSWPQTDSLTKTQAHSSRCQATLWANGPETNNYKGFLSI